MGRGQDDRQDGTADGRPRGSEGGLGGDDALFEAQMRSLDVRPAHAVRGGRGRPRAGRGKRRPAATPLPGAPQGATAGAPSDDDDALFLQAMAAMDRPGVATPAGTVGRVSPGATHRPALGTEPGEPRPTTDLRAEDALFAEAMARLEHADSGEGASPGPKDEALAARPAGPEQARRFVGTPKALRRRIRNGDIQAQGELDLHGQRRDEARRALAGFIREAVSDGHEVLRIICGRGLHSAQGPVLRQAVREWLTGDHRQVVAEVVSAPPAYGGEGVWYAFLRRFSPSQPQA